MSNTQSEEYDLFDTIKNWDWDLNDLANWFEETANFHVQMHGWIAWVLIAFVVIVVLLNLDATRHSTSLIINTIFRQTVGAAINGVFIIAGLSAIWIKDQFIARSRHTSRAISNLFSSSDHKDDQS